MSKNFTKRDLVLKISHETGETQETVFNIVQKTLDYLNAALAEGKTVEIRNFGVLKSASPSLVLDAIRINPKMTFPFPAVRSFVSNPVRK